MILYSIYFSILVQIIIVGLIDFKTRKISNWWPIANIVLYVTFLFLLPEQYLFSWQTLQFPLGFLLVGFFLFAFRIGGVKIMGGGDAKYIFSILLLTPAQLHESLLINLLYVTIVVGSTFLLLNLFRARKKIVKAATQMSTEAISGVFGKKFPFSPLLLIAWLWMGLEILKLAR